MHQPDFYSDIFSGHNDAATGGNSFVPPAMPPLFLLDDCPRRVFRDPPPGYTIYGQPAPSDGFIKFVLGVAAVALVLAACILAPAIAGVVRHSQRMALMDRETPAYCGPYETDAQRPVCDEAMDKAAADAVAAYPDSD